MADLTEGSTISLADDILLPTLARFKANHPDKGILKLLAQLKLEHSGWAISEKRNVGKPRDLVADTGLDHSVDISTFASHVQVKMLDMSGKKSWIVTADVGNHQYLTQSMMCSQCFSVFTQPSPPLTMPCPYCTDACFCNRFCSKSILASHPPLLCPELNLDAASLWGENHIKIKAEEIDKRAWKGMAKASHKRKEMERQE
nr:hypothetical protein L203_03138 [Cryptococcus depauperatus CBS 7841]